MRTMNNKSNYKYENENARLLAQPLLHKYISLNPRIEISEETAMSMYLFVTTGAYYTNKENQTFIPILKFQVS